MSISTPSFSGGQQQQQHHFRPTNPRFIDNNGPRLRLPPPPPTSGDTFGNHLTNPHWTNNDHTTYHVSPQLTRPIQSEQQQVLTSQLFQKHQLIPVFLLQ
jgi:hypothetical protein